MSVQAFGAKDRNDGGLSVLEQDVMSFFLTLTPPIDLKGGKIAFTIRINPNNFKLIEYLEVGTTMDARQIGEVTTRYPELEAIAPEGT